MTDEQRQQLIRDLNAVANAPRYGGACSVCKEAAEEIERLTTLLTVLQRDRAMGGDDMNEQPDAEPVACVTDEMVMAACDVLFERTSIAFSGEYMRETLEAALNPKQVALYIHRPTAPPRPDVSKGISISDAEQVLDGIGEALEARGYSHMTNGKSIGDLLDELETLRAQSDAAEAIAAEIRGKPEFKEMVAQAHALAQSDAQPVAWQWQEKATPEFGWAFCRNEEERFYLAQYPSKYNLRPLYTAPPYQHFVVSEEAAKADLLPGARRAK